MSAANLIKVQAEESAKDQKAANDMVFASTENTNKVVFDKKEDDLAKAEKDAVSRATEDERKAKAAAVAQELKDHQKADDAYMVAVEQANRKYREKKEAVDKSAATGKVQATELKDSLYTKTTKQWETAKNQARASEVKVFRKLDAKAGASLSGDTAKRDAAMKKAQAGLATSMAAMKQKKKTALAQANTELTQAQVVATKKKAVRVQQLSAEVSSLDQARNQQDPIPAPKN